MGNTYKLNWREQEDDPPEVKLTRWEKVELGVIAALLGAMLERVVFGWLTH
jgi:hypothetical protein